ncbi:MAG TPA: OmpA family protein [Microvirga sp.]|nr:OmpA family protein [Microvirga sp.]
MMAFKRLARSLMAGTVVPLMAWGAGTPAASAGMQPAAAALGRPGSEERAGEGAAAIGGKTVLAQRDEREDPRERRDRGSRGGGRDPTAGGGDAERRRVPPRLQGPGGPEGGGGGAQQRELERQQRRQETAPPDPAQPPVTPRGAFDRRDGFGAGFGDRRDVRIDELRRLRRERAEQGGRRIIIEEQDRVIVREGDRYTIQHDETDRFRRVYEGAHIRRERRGNTEVTVVRRPDRVEIITVRDLEGNLVRRLRREPTGREIVLIDNIVERRPRGRTIIEETVRLPPPEIHIPREKYIVEVESASQEELYEAFTAPPVERVQRSYTLDEVRSSAALRERVRRVDVDTITFDFGSWELSEEQARALTGVGQALRRAIERNPAEVFLIEGHTDAVGNEVDNLTLSDRRAETVATILTQMFGVPAENLTTQGYGEQYLKIDTQEPERENRRVTIRRITPLLQNEARR